MGSFYDDLKFGEHAEKRIQEEIRKLFPTATKVERTGDSTLQKEGIDYVLWFSSAVTAGVQLKTRDREYGDVFLEKISNTRKNTPGWIKTCKAMYIAYLFPGGRLLMLPTLLLQNAYEKHKGEWEAEAEANVRKEAGACMWQYGTTTSESDGSVRYHSKGLCVPIDRLLKAITDETLHFV